MTFAVLQDDFINLKRRLAIHVGANAIPDVTVAPPKGTSDELSFIRLVSWGYALIYESGKTSLGFLRELPPWSSSSADLVPHVRSLRTWTSHNLNLEKAHDLKTIRTAVEWFSRTCGAGTPSTTDQWSKCFSALVSDLHRLLQNAICACDSFELDDDRENLVKSLKERLNRNWDAHRFDPFVTNTMALLGYKGIDVVSFRASHLDHWRKVVAISEEGGIEENLTLRIEADLLQLMRDALPMSSEQLQRLLNFIDSNALVAGLLALRAQNAQRRKDTLTYLQDMQGN